MPTSNNLIHFIYATRAAYNGLAVKDDDTLYIVEELGGELTLYIGSDQVGAKTTHTHGTYNRASSPLTGASVFSDIIVSDGIITGLNTRTITPANIGAQTYDADLAAIAALAGTSGLLRKTAADTWSLDTNTYITGITKAMVEAVLTGTITSHNHAGTYQAYDADLDAIAALSGTSGILRKTGVGTWALDTNTYITGNQTITLSGDVSGSGTTSIAVTLANSGVTAGTYKSVTVDAKGRVTAGSNPTTLSGYGITDAQPLDADLTAIAALTGTSGILRKTAANTWSLDTNTYLTGITKAMVEAVLTGNISTHTHSQYALISGQEFTGDIGLEEVSPAGAASDSHSIIFNRRAISTSYQHALKVDINGDLLYDGTELSLVGHTHDDRYYTESEITTFLAGKSDTGHTHTFASLTSKPTNLAGYGITDAYTQGQVNTLLSDKQDNITGAATTITTSNLTVNRALISDGSGKVAVSAVTGVELAYLSGATSAIQTQLNGKQATITGAATTITSSNLTASRALVSDGSGKVAVSTITSTELSYLSGGTSNIQTQLDGKALVENSIYYVEGNTTGTSGQWTGTIPGITALYNGLTVRYRIGISGADPTYLNINGYGNNQVWRYYGARHTTHWPAGTIVTLTYRASEGYWYNDADYNSTDDYNIRWQGNIIFAEATQGYHLLMEGIDGRFIPVTSGGNAASTTNTISSAELRVDGLMLYYGSAADYAAGATGGAYYLYESIYSNEMEYWSNKSSGWAVANKPFYIVCTMNANGNFVLDGAGTTGNQFLTQALPTTDDSKYYIQVGFMHNTYDAWRLDVAHPIYQYKDGKLRLYVPEHTHPISDIVGLQTALDGKQATITGAATSIVSSNLTASRVLISDGSGKVAVSSITSTTLGYLDATSSIQTQLNGKEPAFTKNTAFNKNFGTSAGTVSEGNHTHSQYALITGQEFTGDIGLEEISPAGVSSDSHSLIFNRRAVSVSYAHELKVDLNGSLLFDGNKVWNAGNDGSGSGLDADTLDGNQASAFMKLTGLNQYVVAAELGSYGNQVNTLQLLQNTASKDSFMSFHIAGDYAVHFGLDYATNDLFVGGWSMGAVKNKIWHAGNDGSGSGLDADLLDGYNASTSATANTVVVRDNNNYIYANYINSNRGNETSTAASYIYDTGDGWMRKKTLANVQTEIVTKSAVESALTGNITTHTHSYLPLSGGTLTGNLTLEKIGANNSSRSIVFNYNSTIGGDGSKELLVDLNGNLYFGGTQVSLSGHTHTPSQVGLGNVTNDAQIKKLASSTAYNVPIWADGNGNLLSNGYGVQTTLSSSTSHLVRADAIVTALAAKEPTISAGTSAQYWRGDKTWQTLNSSAVGLGNVSNYGIATQAEAEAGTLDNEYMTPLKVKYAIKAINPTDIGTTKTSTSSFAIGDANKFFQINNSGAITLTIPTNASVAFPVGTEIHLMRLTANDVTLFPASGVTLYSEGTKRKINAQYQVVTLKKLATNTWALFGALKS